MNIGDYVRTETGQIGKITYFEGDMVRVDCDKFITYKNNHNEIIKISPNIIDLIEIGDYVNGMPVLHKENNELICGLLLKYKEENINSIVTKEQFSSMEYKIGE